MPGYPGAPSVQTVADKLASLTAPGNPGNVAGYYVYLRDHVSGTIYESATPTDSGGNWSIASVPAGTYQYAFGPHPNTQYPFQGSYLVALNPAPYTQGHRALGNKIAFLMDSIGGSVGSVWVPDDGSHNLNSQGRGFPTFGCFLNGQRTRWANACKSAGGITSTTVIPFFTSDILPQNPNACVILVGQNDAQQNTSLDPFRANMLTLIGLCKANKILPILCTNQANSQNGSALNQMLRNYSAYVKELGATFGFPVLDLLSLTADPASATGAMLASVNSGDNVHLSDAGQFTVAAMLNDAAFLQFFPPVLPPLTTDTADPTNMLANGTMQGAGPVATSWTNGLTGADTGSTQASAAPVMGQWQQILAAAAAGTGQITQTVAAGASTFAVGDRIVLCGRFMSSGSVAGGAQWSTGAFGIGGANQGWLAKAMSIWNIDVAAPGGVFYGEFVVPAGITSIQVALTRNGAAGTGRWAQVTLRNLSKWGMDVTSMLANSAPAPSW